MGKRVILTLLEGNFEQGFPALLRIREDGAPAEREIQVDGHLPPNLDISKQYDYWQLAYCQLPGMRSLKPKSSPTERPCSQLIDDLIKSLNVWLNYTDSQEWQKMRDGLLRNLNVNDEIRVIIQTENIWLRRLPWHMWDLFAKYYTQAEIALSAPNYNPPLGRKLPAGNRVRILAVLGDKKGSDKQTVINNEIDLNLLKQHLGNQAEIVHLLEPIAKDFYRSLWNPGGWHILFFAGHSESEIDVKSGWIKINPNDSLTISDFKNALSIAIENGLQLAIFNSCNGLGLANELESLHIPQVIVMRERVSDKVAPDFLDHFLTAFYSNNSLYTSMREARKKLEGWDKEYPGTSWLPVICQNPAVEPLTWEGLLPKKVEALAPFWVLKHTLTGHSDVVKSVAIHPDGEILASCSLDQTIKLWSLITGELINTINEHTSGVTCITFTSDGKILVSSSANPDGTIKFWDTKTWKIKGTLKADDWVVLSIWSIAISPDGKTLVSGHHADSTVKVWDLETRDDLDLETGELHCTITGKLRHTLRGHVWAVHSVAVSPDGQTIASASFDSNIKIWNARTGRQIRNLNGPGEGPVGWTRSFFSDYSVYSVTFSPDGKTLASGGAKQPIKLWRLSSGENKSTLTGHSGDVYSVAFSPDGKVLASGSSDRTIRIWDLFKGEPLHTLGHSDTVYTVAFSPDGQTLVSGSKDKTIKIWHLSS